MTPAGAVFVSYRRADAQGWAGRLGADLAAAFGDVARFFDLQSIVPGADYRAAIDAAIASADAVLVLIGPRWLDLRNPDGARRIDAADDVVAAEVAAALAGSRLVIPVLLGGAAMPAAAALPPALVRLAARNACELSDQRWDHDRDRLFAALEAATPLRRGPTSPAAAAAAVNVGAGLVIDGSEVGRVTGVRGGPAPAGGVGVLQGARLTNTRIGDITGVEIAPSKDAQ